MEVFIEPCENLLPEKCKIEDVKENFDHLCQEHMEVCGAWKEVEKNLDDGKAIEHLAEELVDLMTMCLTMLVSLTRMDNVPKFLIKAVTYKVFCKNYGRGYHDNTRMWEYGG